MACIENTTPCTDDLVDCSCPQKDMSTDCSTYTGDDLPCSGIKKHTLLTEVIGNLDAHICNKFTEAINYLTLLNVGTGAEIFKGINGIGNKEIRTVLSDDTSLLDVIQNTDTINIKAGTHRLELNSTTDILSLIVNTLSGDRVLTNIDLSEYNYDTFVQSATFDNNTQILTVVRNNGEPSIAVDLGFLNNHLETSVYNPTTSTVTYTLTDASTVNLDLTTLVNEILTAASNNQVQSDYLESSSTSKAYIANRNPSKTVALGVGGTYTVVSGDNNYIIEIDNGVNDVTIDVAALTETSEFFVAFIQKGTGEVIFTGQDIVPDTLTNVLYGQGHTCAMEIINNTKYLIGGLKFA